MPRRTPCAARLAAGRVTWWCQSQAGARVGTLVGPAELSDRMATALGPWAVPHPARWAARLALRDAEWQAVQRLRLAAAAARLSELLGTQGLGSVSGTALFQYVVTARAAEICDALARCGILVRLFASPAALRFGLPGTDGDWRRLQDALSALR
ncbi:MAG: aminotransferase class I/II-fold pyridoxal phosphate-dependent enzyme [Gammaproteobacteria bacterium]